jgi:hypothetical protein
VSANATAAASARELTRGDRCDSCGAEAFVLVTMSNGLELFFCGHHFSKNEAGLAAQGAAVAVDNRASLNTKPSSSANA